MCLVIYIYISISICAVRLLNKVSGCSLPPIKNYPLSVKMFSYFRLLTYLYCVSTYSSKNYIIETEDKVEDEEIKTDVFPIFSTKITSNGDYSFKEEIDCRGTGVVCHAPSGQTVQKDGCNFT